MKSLLSFAPQRCCCDWRPGSKAAASRREARPFPRPAISFGTATPGGGFPLYGNAFAEVMNAADPTMSIEPRNTKGSNENIPLLEAGSSISRWWPASRPMKPSRASAGRATHLKILTAMYSSPGMFVVRADSPYKTIRDLVGKPIAFGAKGSGLPILSRYILDGLGLKQDEDFQSIYLDRAGDGPAMVLDGRAAALWGAGIGWPGFSRDGQKPGRRALHRARCRRDRAHPGQAQLPQAADDAGRQLSRPDRGDQLDGLLELYPGARESARRCGLSAGEDAARRRGRRSARNCAQACETTAANTVAAAPNLELIHPGVLKYFREIGVAK